MSPFDALHALLRNLPFGIDDIAQVNDRYLAWYTQRRDTDARVVDLWTYCYVWRYLLIKFTKNEALNEVDMDVLLARIYETVVDRRGMLRHRDRYASWVSVVCHHQFVNYLRARRLELVRDYGKDEEPIVEATDTCTDVFVLYHELDAAIARLPDYLRLIAELRVMHDRSYEDISFLTDKSVVVVRSYVNKALLRLRNDAHFACFCALHYDDELDGLDKWMR